MRTSRRSPATRPRTRPEEPLRATPRSSTSARGGPSTASVAPRPDEPFPDPAQAPTFTLADSAVGAAVQARWWRERSQADALQTGDLSHFFVDVDFGKLAAGTNDDSG